MSLKKILLAALLALTMANTPIANAQAKNDFEFVATVNGTPITKGLFDLNLKAAIAQGQKDTPQLREAIKNELINRQLIVQ